MRSVIVALVLVIASGSYAAVEVGPDQIVVTSPSCTATFSPDNGSILKLSQPGKDAAILRSGEQGLWQARFRDNSTLSAAAFQKAGERVFAATEGAALNLTYTALELAVTITVTPAQDGLEFRAQVTPRTQVLLDFALPGRLRFDPAQVNRFISPMSSGSSVGIACNAAFFAQQPQDKPSGWQPAPVGTAGYVKLYGAPLDQREDRDPPVALTVTAEGKEWLGEALAGRLQGAQATVNRPPAQGQADLTLLASPNGPYLSASHLGGTGYLWRLGGGVNEDERGNALAAVVAVVEKLAASAGEGRRKLGLVALTRSPEMGGWSQVPVEEWRARLRQLRAVTSGKLEFAELTSAKDMLAAAGAGDYVAILNPYGEWAPVEDPGGMDATVAAVGQYVRGGGNWIEVGGYPFFYAMQPLRYLWWSGQYPSVFADYLHLDSRAGTASIYRVQPQNMEPWVGAQDRRAIFIPGRLGFGGDEQGGYCDRTFCAFIPAGETWQPPAVRLAVGNTVAADLAAYCQANAITKRLQDKLSTELLAKFRESVLVYYGGTAQEKTEHLELLPKSTLIHFADYLKGGFDKEYPDHLPPHQRFGTPVEFRAFFDKAHGLGHLVMPYTNPTWWCDHPRGPTFEREGDAPLLKDLDGKPRYERYSQNDGWTVCHWHPAVQAANRKTVRQFTDEYPVDVLFQDQCGARGWSYDTNPASPTPYAYTEGLLSMVAEDSRTKPLSTEGGWDRVVNSQVQLCGMTWSIVPTENRPPWSRDLGFPAETWTVFPVAEYLAHDKTSMGHHDLGQFVTNDEVLAWTLGLGFGQSYRIAAADLTRDQRRHWLLWLDRVQKSVCARYVGEPVQAFEHTRGAGASEGVMVAQYGPVKLSANLDGGAREVGGKRLAGYGFYATAPGMTAGSLADASFVTEGKADAAEIWVYGPATQQVAVEVPQGMAGKVTVQWEGGQPAEATVAEGRVALRLPERAEKPRVQPPAALQRLAPLQWPEKPAIGVLDLKLVGLSWTKITPLDWGRAIAASRLEREWHLPVKRLTTMAEIKTALQEGPPKWLAIINPHGESFPSEGPGKWREALDAIRNYVNNGGIWWETVGYSFYRAVYPAGEGWEGEAVGPSGLSYLGLPIGGGEVDQAPEPLHVTAEGRAWLGEELAGRIGRLSSTVNRGALRGSEDPGHVTLVAGAEQDFLAGYRLDGWGWLWRCGGFNPEPQVLLPAAAASLEYLYSHPAPAVVAGGTKYLWHATLRK